MDTDNGANHVYVDVADDGANNNDGDGDCHLDPDTLAKRDHPGDAEHYRQVVEQHLPRANTNTNTNTNKMQTHIKIQESILFLYFLFQLNFRFSC